MSAIIFLHYFFVNVLGLRIIPRNVTYNNVSYFSVGYKDAKGINHISYSTYVDRSNKTVDLFNVSDRFEYIVYLKAVYALWKKRNEISFWIDNY